MRTKSGEAQRNLINQIIKLLPSDDYIGEFEKKHYFWSRVGKEKIQVAISLACPKDPIVAINDPNGFVGDGIDFEIASKTIIYSTAAAVEASEEEIDRLKNLMEKLEL